MEPSPSHVLVRNQAANHEVFCKGLVRDAFFGKTVEVDARSGEQVDRAGIESFRFRVKFKVELPGAHRLWKVALPITQCYPQLNQF